MNFHARFTDYNIRSGFPAARIFWIYVIAATTWIVVSDYFIEIVLPDHADHFYVQLGKGIFFVLFSGGVLYLLLSRTQHQQMSLSSQLRDAIGATRDGIWSWDLVRNRISATPGGDTELGWPAAQTIRNQESWRAIVHPDDWPIIETTLADLTASGDDAWLIHQRFQTHDGDWNWFEIKGRVIARVPDGAPALMEGTYHSINALKQLQTKLQSANRALQVLVIAYDSVSRAKSRHDIFTDLISQLIATNEYCLVWVGEARNDHDKTVEPLAYDGPSIAFLKSARISWDDEPEGNGPTGTAIKSAQPSVIGDILDDSVAVPWLDEYKAHGIRSVISIPITVDGHIDHILQLASSMPQAFCSDDTENYRLVSQILSFAVSNLDLEGQFAKSESERHLIGSRLEKALLGAVTALAKTVETRDPYTAGHQARVADVALAIAARLGLSMHQREGIRIGAWIHDIGKTGVPTEILTKPGRLDETELALIRRHPQIGYEIVKNIDFGWPVEDIVHQHHERFDGSGYPQGLKGNEICLEARIVAVADVIESMATNRPYRPSIPWNTVVAEITNGRGTLFDPDVVDAALMVLKSEAVTLGLRDK